MLDITMPDVDGLTALKEIRRYHPDAKITMCIAMGQQALVMEALKVGALDFIVKPFDAERVLAAMKKLVR